MSDDEDDYIAFGKQLKELVEGDIIRKRPITVEEQIATDERGKRRFHGAFTGGFSAGFFNTVDTPEGWAPKQFKSSRGAQRSTDDPGRRAQRPEDFMDDEDLGDFGFAAQGLKTKGKFQTGKSSGVQETRAPRREGGGNVLGAVIDQLIKPTQSTIGERLLMKQGWKPGQGIGPKITKLWRKSREQSYKNTYGSQVEKGKERGGAAGTEEGEDDDLLEKYKDFLFAPDELPVNIAEPKDNFFGIAYKGLDRNSLFQSSDAFSLKSGVAKKKFSISGEAFGVGVYEEDDEDVYSRNDMGQYDFAIDLNERAGGKSKNKEKSKTSQSAISHVTDVLEGFHLGTAKSSIKKHFPPPDVPRNWTPRADPTVRKSRFEPATDKTGSNSTAAATVTNTNPTREQRRSILFPDERSAATAVAEKSGLESGQPVEEDKSPAVLPDFLKNKQPSANSIVSTFKPFTSNPEKQTRYEQYLVCLENNRKDALKLLQPKGMTEWEKERERVEFERAAVLYQPLRASMVSRFVSAGSALDDTGNGGLVSVKDDNSEKRKAAEMKMFGQLTRETNQWVPARLLCIRFNVKNPFIDKEESGVKKKKAGFESTELFSRVDQLSEARAVSSTGDKPDEDTPATDAKRKPAEKTIKVKNEPLPEILPEKPPMDLFRAIFADSDDSSEDEKEDADANDDDDDDEPIGPVPPQRDAEDEPAAGPSTAGHNRLPEPSNNSKRPDPARGIFANIDFDALNRRRRARSPPPVTRDKVAPSKAKSVLDQSVRTVLGIRSKSSSDDEYGPSLPPINMAISEKIVISSDSDEESDDNKHKKKKSKHKKHKKEKKKKKKNHKSSKD